MRIAHVTETWLPSINGVVMTPIVEFRRSLTVTRLGATVAELARAGHQVLVVAPTVPGPEHIEPAGATVRHVPSVGLPFIYSSQPLNLGSRQQAVFRRP